MNKFDNLDNIVKTCDIFLISELKLDNAFPINQFTIGNYKVLDVIIIASEMAWYYTLTKTFYVSL